MGSSSNNHPEYPDPSLLINVSNFVSIKLTASNYQLWKTQMLCFIDNVGLLDFIDGTTPTPPPPLPSSSSNGTMAVPNNEYRRWRRLDQRLKGWILGSLSEEALATVVGFDTASEVWTALQHSFGPYLQPLVQMEENPEHEAAEEHIDLCRGMYTAVVTGNLDFAESILSTYPNAINARIASGSQTALHVAVWTKNTYHIVEKFVESMTTDQLEKQTTEGNTALSVAAMVGNAQAAAILVGKHTSLLYTENCNHSLPMHMAAKYGHGNTLWYLLTATEDHLASQLPTNPFEGQSGVQLVVDVITSGFIEIALYLVQRYPRLAVLKIENGDSPLTAIARKASAFRSGNHYHFWEKIIYFCYPVGPVMFSDIFGLLSDRNVMALRDEVVKGRGNNSKAVSRALHVGRQKMAHLQALELVETLCKGILYFSGGHSYRLHWEKPILMATSLGIHEVVEKIVQSFPAEVWFNGEDRNCIFLLAVKYRCKKVFNLIYQIGHKYSFSVPIDNSKNNILHMAAKLAPLHKLNQITGAALQMQSELQWFKEVQMFVNPGCKQEENSSKETPGMVFTREHSKLVVEGERWMKDRANSFGLVAALITTVMFAAAISVPGGNNENNGLPNYFKRTAFKIFFFSDAVSLFTSVTSLTMFLSILTSRYAEEDFLYVLPNRLIIGLVTLFASIASMMIAFCCILDLQFGQSDAWIDIPLILLSCPPLIYMFMFLPFSFFIDVIYSTYGRAIFRK